MLLAGSAIALLAWLCVLAAPHGPHRVRERLEAAADAPAEPTEESK